MSEPTCKNCIHYHNGVCLCRHISLPEECDICTLFAYPDGKRPRFCQLASSVDEMVKQITDTVLACVDVSRNSCGKPVTFSDEEKGRISAEIKAWLLEVEE